MLRYAADVLVASSPDCIAYLSGYDPFVPRFLYTAQSYCIYAPASNKRILVCGAAEAPNGVEANAFDEIFTVGEFYFHMPETAEPFNGRVHAALSNRYESMEKAVSAAIAAVSMHPKRIAVEEQRASIGVWQQLVSDYGEDRVVYGGQLLLLAKRVKHPKEIEQLAAAARAADEAFYEMAGQIRLGMSEADLYELYCIKCLQRHTWPHFCVVTCDTRSAFVDTHSATTQLVQQGSVLRFDFGCRRESFYSDIARMVTIGGNAKAEAYYPWIRAGVEAGIRAARPGAIAADVFSVMVQAVREGIPHYQRNHTGHGIGLAMYDAPSIAPGNDTVLEAGMVLCLETPYYEIGWGGIMLEETILIGENETVCLSGGPRELLRLNL